MANEWLRLWHDMPTDPKWRTIARHSKQSIGNVIALYTHILVAASKAKTRGNVENLSAEDLASALDLETPDVESMLSAMQGRVIIDGRLKGWETRQPSREDGATGSRSSGSGDNYIYFVGATSTTVVKIGFSRNPWSRIKDMQTGSNNNLMLLGTLKTKKRSESRLHEFFKNSRSNGEWFFQTTALKLLINKVKNKEIVDIDQCYEFLNSLPETDFLETTRTTVATVEKVVTTKDKDKDKEEDKDKEKKNTHTGEPRVAGAVCVALRSEGMAQVNPSHPELLALLDQGARIEDFISAGRIAKERNKGFAYVLGIVKGQLADAKRLAEEAANAPPTTPRKSKDPPWWISEQSINAKAATLGLRARPGEDMANFKARIEEAIRKSQGGEAA